MKPAITKDNLLTELGHCVPNKPFLAIIGTSHTAGDCNSGHVGVSYGKLLADKLGLDFLNLGSSGAFNEDLLEITLTAINSGLLDNCKLVIIEGRLGTTIKKISKVPVKSYYDDLLSKNLDNYGSSRIIETSQFNEYSDNYQGIDIDLYTFDGDADITLDETKQRVDDKTETSSYAIYKLNEYIKSKIYYESHTPMNIYNDMLLLHAMCNILSNRNIETYWFNVAGHPVRTNFAKSLYEKNILYKNKENFDHDYNVYIEQSLSMQTELIKRHSRIAFDANLCKCSHGNQTMHYWMADILMEKLNAARNN